MSKSKQRKGGASNKRKGFARVEFLAVYPDVLELIEKGHTKASAYALLQDEGRVTMSYARFLHYLNHGVILTGHSKPYARGLKDLDMDSDSGLKEKGKSSAENKQVKHAPAKTTPKIASANSSHSYFQHSSEISDDEDNI